MGKVNIRKRGKYFEYRVEVALIDNKRQWISKSGYLTLNEALEAGNRAYTEYKEAGIPFKSCDMSYSDYLDYWIDNYCMINLKYNTIQTYKVLIRKYIKTRLGKYKLSTITSVCLNNFISDLVNEFNLSKSYFKNILKVVKGSFRDACNIYGFIKYNPALTIRLPRIIKDEEDIKHLYTQEEIDKILDRFKNNSTFTCAFLMSCFTGMRTGEVFALTWNDIDFENNFINVNKTVYDKPKDKLGRWFIGTTKTKSGKRQVNISPTLKVALLNYKKRQEYFRKIFNDNYKKYCLENVVNKYGKVIEQRIVENNNKEIFDLVFTKEDGTYSGTDITKYPYKIIKNELGIKCRFYDLRGSFATKILNNGIEIRDITDLLGHRNIETTENYYISSTNESKLKATDSIEEVTHSDIINEIVEYKIGV